MSNSLDFSPTGAWTEEDRDVLPSPSGSAIAPLEEVRAGRAHWFAYTALATLTTLNPTFDAVEGFKHYFPQGTTSIVVEEPVELPSTHSELLTLLPAHQQIRDILHHLGMSKTQLKDACGVSRQTLYDWIRGKYEPEPANAKRLAQIHRLAARAEQHPSAPLRAKLLKAPTHNGSSLLDLLNEQHLRVTQLEDGLMHLLEQNQHLKERTASATRARLGFSTVSEEDRDNNLDANLHELSEWG